MKFGVVYQDYPDFNIEITIIEAKDELTALKVAVTTTGGAWQVNFELPEDDDFIDINKLSMKELQQILDDNDATGGPSILAVIKIQDDSDIIYKGI